MTISYIRKYAGGIFLTTCALMMSAQAYGESYFGFSPIDPDMETVSAGGHGINGYSEAAISIDPVSNPVVNALKGAKILGMRCYMRSDYRQKNKRTSALNIRRGTLDAAPEKFYADFTQGWNEILLDTPVEIGDEPLYIGPMVYETSANPYPFVSVPGPGFPGGFNVSLDKEDWQIYTQRGNLLMQVILDREPELMPAAAAVALSEIPLVVAPAGNFSCSMAVHNFSGSPLESVEITTVADNGAAVFTRTVEFETPVAPFDSQVVDALMETGTAEGTAVEYRFHVSKINGSTSEAMPEVAYNLHVTQDAFLRIPLVEEFTSQMCTNCPFMMYYIDRAMEEFNRPHVYMTRHSGFVKDSFSIREDEDLLYLFGKDNPFNPAVMYDRTIFEENGSSPVSGASTASIQPYLEALEKAAAVPALAKIIVEGGITGSEVSCVVRGKVARDIDTDNLYICAYLVESGIPRDEKNFQTGIDDAPEDAPEDLAETFRHNGIIRVKFHKQNLGDILTVDPDTKEFRVDFGTAEVKDGWVADNCEIVAFICRIDKENLDANKILNAGGTRWNEVVEPGSSVNAVKTDSSRLIVSVGPDRIVRAAGQCTSLEIHSLAGQKHDASAPLPKGIYIVSATLPDGMRRSAKVAVR